MSNNYFKQRHTQLEKGRIRHSQSIGITGKSSFKAASRLWIEASTAIEINEDCVTDQELKLINWWGIIKSNNDF